VTTSLTAKQACLARAAAQHLAGVRQSTVVGAVQDAVGLQAQDIRAARLQVRVRTRDLTASDVDNAVAERHVVRTWAMRGTLHMLAAEDAPWIVGLLGPYFAKRLAGRRRQLGLDEATAERGREVLHTLLSKETPLTRAELVTRLADHGLPLDPKSQAPAHLLAYAAMTGLIQRGPEAVKDEPTYELSTNPSALSPDEALARLAARYLAGYGPATESDFAAWSGLPLGQARQGFEAAAPIRVTVDGRRNYLASEVNISPDIPPEARLLGHFDTYLLGYRSRELALPPELDRRIQAGGGFINPAVLVDGRVEGTWRHTNKKGHGTVTVEPFTAIQKRLWPRLLAEAEDLGRFLGTPIACDFPT
jgi:hypothetical protein